MKKPITKLNYSKVSDAAAKGQIIVIQDIFRMKGS